MKHSPIVSSSRRSFLKSAAAVAAVSASLGARLAAAEKAAAEEGAGGTINHSVCKWCYPEISLEDLCVAGKEFGLQSVELVRPEDMAVLEKHGMTCAMMTFPTGTTADGVKVGTIENGFNRVEHHDALVETYEPYLKKAADVGVKQVICFSGNRDGMDDEQGLENCATGLKRLLPTAEKLGITLSMELLNSRVNHADYMADKSAWGVALCEKIGSENFKLLFDIYHMQVMEGDLIATIRRDHRYFSHYHTAGVPGRHEIDDSQEINYPAVMRAIADTGYRGFVGQEFIPAREDKIASLRQGVEICDI